MAGDSALKKYLLYSSILCVFSEVLSIRSGIDLKFSYVIILLNSLLLLAAYGKRVSYNIAGFFFILYLLITGLFSIYNGTNSLTLFLSQILGIFISSFYFYNFFRLTEVSVTDLFIKYCKICVYVSALGILITLINYASGDFSYRLKSIFNEPAHFCGTVMPAFYFYLKHRKGQFKSFLIMLVAIALSLSSVGYIGILVCLLLYPRKINLFLNSAIAAICVLIGFVLYLNVESVRLRIADTYSSLTTLNVTDINLSSYALISNLYVAKEVFKESPVTGNGLGSHQVSHGRYIKSLKGVDTIGDYYEFNKEDANSLFLRILSDLGLVGLTCVFYFIAKNYAFEDENYILARAMLVYFFYKLLREGHYFSPEMYFFVFLYIYNKKKEKLEEYFNSPSLKIN